MTQPAEQITLNDIVTRITERVGSLGVEIDELPVPHIYSWWHPQYGSYQNFRHGEPHPWDPKLAVVALFRDDDEIRVYTVRVQAVDEGEKPELSPLKRYMLSKRNQSYEVELLTLENFVQSIADEWMIVAESMTTADAERERIVDFLREEHFGQLADRIEQLEHLEDEEPEPPAPAPDGGSTSPSSLS